MLIKRVFDLNKNQFYERFMFVAFMRFFISSERMVPWYQCLVVWYQ